MGKREAIKTSLKKGKKSLGGFWEMEKGSAAVALDFVVEFFHIVGEA